MSDQLHKIHLKSLTKTESKIIDFAKDKEGIEISSDHNDKIKSILSNENLNHLFNENKDKELIKLFSMLDLSNIQNFFNKSEKLDPKKLQKLSKNINLLSKNDKDIEEMIERILIIYRMVLIKKIFSSERINDCLNSIKNI